MNDLNLRKLSRSELLKLLLSQMKANQDLQSEISSMKEYAGLDSLEMGCSVVVDADGFSQEEKAEILGGVQNEVLLPELPFICAEGAADEPQSELELETKMSSGIEFVLESESEPEPESEIDQQVDSESESELESESESELGQFLFDIFPDPRRIQFADFSEAPRPRPDTLSDVSQAEMAPFCEEGIGAEPAPRQDQVEESIKDLFSALEEVILKTGEVVELLQRQRFDASRQTLASYQAECRLLCNDAKRGGYSSGRPDEIL